MKRLFYTIAVLILFSGSFAHAEQVTWKFATLAPKGMGWASQVTKELIPFFAESTENTLNLKIYWGGVMGDDEDFISKMKSGRLDGAGLSGQGAAMAAPEFLLVQLPFLFNDFDEVDYIREKMFPAYHSFLKKNGIELIGWIDQDFDRVYSTNQPVSTVQDFQGSRIVCWAGEAERRFIQKMRGIPVELNVPDIPSAIKAGKVDINLGPAIWIVGSQLHATVKYVNPIKIRYLPALITCSNRSWDKLEKNHRDNIVSKRERVTRDFCEQIRKDNEKFHEAMLAYGVKEVLTSKEEQEKIKKRALPVWSEMAGGPFTQELLDEVLMHLESFRQGKGE